MRRHLLYLLCCVSALGWSAETIVVGDVVSAETGEPIAGASIYYMSTHQGTASNDEGSFYLRADLSRKRTLVVSAVGYRTERYAIEPGTLAGIQVELREQTSVLQEVLVQPGENPALPLLARVREQRPHNDRYLHPDWAATGDDRTELYISDIQPRHLRRSLWKTLQSGMLQREDSTYLLPLYTRQQSMRLEGDRIQGILPAEEHALVMDATDYQVLLQVPANLCFYRNTLSLMGHSFVSPLSTSGQTYYNYYLADSAQTEHGKQYTVHFRTKNPFYATFDGQLLIDSASSAITALTARVPAQSSVNYLRSMQISQRFAADHTLAEEDIVAVLDCAVKTDSSHLFPSALVRRQLRTQPTSADRPLAPTEVAQAIDSNQANETQALMDSLSQMPIIRTARWIASTILTGYMPTPYGFDFGPVNEMLQLNSPEMVHLGLGLRTNQDLWQHVSLEAGIGYGVRDNAWKGHGAVSVLIPSTRRHLLSLRYHDQYAYSNQDDFTGLLQESGIGWSTGLFLHHAINSWWKRDNYVHAAARQRQIELSAQNDWCNILETRTYMRIGWQNYGSADLPYHSHHYYRYQSLGTVFRLGWNERKVDQYLQRRYVYSHYPTIFVGIEGGSWSMPGEQQYRMYAHLRTMIRQTVSLGIGGQMDWMLQAGYIAGRVPYPMLHLFESFPGVNYSPYRFSLMNNYQYATDAYLSAHLNWDGQGVLFNLIPGIRYLRLHELVCMKIAYGGLRADNKQLAQEMASGLPSHASLQAPGIPHLELGFGIGNILRVADLYFIWRLTQRDDPTAPLWGIRFRLHMGS